MRRATRQLSVRTMVMIVGAWLAAACASACGSSSTLTRVAAVQPSSSSPTAQHGSSAAPPSTVARSFSRAYATLLLDGQQASRSQVDKLARQIPTSCSAAQYNQYPCTVHPPNKTPPVQGCAALANTEGHVSLGGLRCGFLAKPFPIVRPGYVDCAHVGHVTTIHGHARRVRSPTWS